MTAPTVFPRSESGLAEATDPGKWGAQPDPCWAFTFHHSAGPRAHNKTQAAQLHRAYQREHESKGWGDIGYHLSMDDLGQFYRLRNIRFVGTHVGGHNTGNIGLMLHGNYDHDELTDNQIDSIRWLFRGGFALLTGSRLTERELSIVRGHQEWPGPTNQGNACPGVNLMRHIRFRRNTETW